VTHFASPGMPLDATASSSTLVVMSLSVVVHLTLE